MIVVEDRLKEIFGFLPQINGYDPVFGYGNKVQLSTFIKSANDRGSDVYPLIWLLYPNKEDHKKRGREVECEDLTLILAVNTKASLSNKERIENVYKQYLIPLADNVRYVLESASIANLNPEFEIIKFPNYSGDLSNGEENYTVDRWDALKCVFSISINNKCLNDIRFKL